MNASTKRPLALAALTLLDTAPPEQILAAAEAGFDYMGIRLVPASENEPRRPLIGRTRMLAETRLRMDDTGVGVFDVEILRLTPQVQIDADFEPFLETGAYLGATQVLVAGNDPDSDRLAHNLSELAELAAVYGLTPNLEFMPWTDVTDLTSALRVIEAAGHDNIGLLIDPIHLDRSATTLDDIDLVPRERLRYAQVCDAPAARPATMDEVVYQARHSRLYPGEGGLDLLGLLRRLPRDLPLSLEAPRRADAGRQAGERAVEAMAAMVELLARLDEGSAASAEQEGL